MTLEAGYEMVQEPRPVSSSPNGIVYVIPVDGEDLYLKFCRTGGNGVSKTLTIGSHFPECTDTIVGASLEYNAILMTDHGQPKRDDLQFAIVQWAEVQKRSVAKVAQLKDMVYLSTTQIGSYWARRIDSICTNH